MEKVQIAFEDRWLLVIEKPAGMVTTRENSKLKHQNLKKDINVYLEDWVGGYLKKSQKSYSEGYRQVKSKKINKIYRNGIVHRLDKDTSGLVVVAKDIKILNKLKAQFKQRQVIKKYIALVGGDLPKEGEIRMPIKRSKYVFGRFKVDVDGKVAVTEFLVIKKVVVNEKKYSLVEVNLRTGRTHQIRVHFSYMGWPLVGDKVYGGTEIDGLGRQFLHSTYIKFLHPLDKTIVEVHSQLPNDLQKVLKKYGN
jgi:23S rRNA pseudouridine1911/1915/1917 synthase